jgi:hypothetical protein
LIKNPLKYSLLVLSNISRKIEFDDPLYCFALPGLLLSAGGLYLGLNSLQTLSLGGGLDFGQAALTVLLTVVGMGLSFTGLLLHSISGLFRQLA